MNGSTNASDFSLSGRLCARSARKLARTLGVEAALEYCTDFGQRRVAANLNDPD